MSDIKLTRYSPTLKEPLIDFLGTGLNWSELSKNKRKELFEWKYDKNPYLDEPLIYLAFQGDKIVGHRAFVVQNFKLKEDYLIGTPADALVHPDHRRKGIFSKLTDFAIKDIEERDHIDLLISLSSTKKSAKGNIKAGFTPVGKREKLYNFSIKKIFKNRYKKEIDFNQIISSKMNGKTIEISQKLKIDDIVELMKISTNYKKFRNLRDRQFYRWRFEEYPKDLIYLYIWDQNDLEAYLSMEKENIQFRGFDLDYYSLLEYGYKDIRLFQELIQALTKKLHLPSIMSYVFTRKKEEKTILRKAGFKGSESYLINSLQKRGVLDEEGLPGLLVKPAKEPVDHSDFYLDNIDTRKEKNWSLFWSDVH